MPIQFCNNPHKCAEDKSHHTHEYTGAVLRKYEENLYHDSYFYAEVWDEKENDVKRVEWGATAYWDGHNYAKVDATPAVIKKALLVVARSFKEAYEKEYANTYEKGWTATAKSKGETVTGEIAWVGEDKPFTAWDRRYGTRKTRVGLKVEGRDKLVFVNAGPNLTVDRPEPTTADRAAWARRAIAEAKQQYAEAIREAKKRAETRAKKEDAA